MLWHGGGSGRPENTGHRTQNTEHRTRGRRMKMKLYLSKSQIGAFFKNRENALAMIAGTENLNDAPLHFSLSKIDIFFNLSYY
jgi:hypothetical protein